MSTQPLTVEIDTGSASSRGRPPDQAWMVRLCRADHCVIVAVGLSRTAAQHLADHIAEIVHAEPGRPARGDALRLTSNGRTDVRRRAVLMCAGGHFFWPPPGSSYWPLTDSTCP
jgi:hypothetical protein